MRNLLNNAINHTPENQEIRICLTPQPAARFQELAGAPILTGNTASFTGDTSAEAAFSVSCCLVEVINPGDPIRVNAAFICRSGVNCGYHGAYLRRPLGERHDYRHGGRMGYQRLGEETSPALVP